MKLKSLFENHYGSLVSQDKLNRMDKADQSLYKYTADGVTGLVNFDKLVDRYPFDGGTLYRGLNFTSEAKYQKFIDTFDGTTSGGSWTPDYDTAEDFGKSPKTYFPTREVLALEREKNENQDYMSGHRGVVLKIENYSGPAIDVSKTSFAKENEVILPSGTYKCKIVKELVPFKHQFADKTSRDALFPKIISAIKSGHRDINGEVAHIVKLYANEMTTKEADLIFQYMYGDALKTIPDDAVIAKIDEHFFSSSKDVFTLFMSAHAFNVEDFVLYDKLSSKVKSSIIAYNKQIGKQLKDKIAGILKDSRFSQIRDFRIHGVDAVTASVGDDCVKALKEKLADLYHTVNSREFTRNMKMTHHEFAEYVREILKAIQAL